MSIFEQLQKSKGTVSSKLGKELADQVLNGKKEILIEAIRFVNYELQSKQSKSIRAGAAKVIEIVAEKKPEMVSPYLEEILPALNAAEPQTRWMIITTFGYCAKYNLAIAIKGVSYAKDFIKEHQGLCLSGAAERYLGEFGAISIQNADIVIPILFDAYQNPLPNEISWIFEAFIKIYQNLSIENRILLVKYANEQLNSHQPGVKKRAEEIIKLSKKICSNKE